MVGNHPDHSGLDRPLRIGDGVYWVGVYHFENRRLSSSYIIHDTEEAVLIDGGSREDFSPMLLKVLQLGIKPGNIKALVYQSSSPWLWGSLHHLQELIQRDDLLVITDRANLMLMKSMTGSAHLKKVEDMQGELLLGSGRRLTFHNTPFAHDAGSFVTFDVCSGVLFSGELFSSYFTQEKVLGELSRECIECQRLDGSCERFEGFCYMHGMMDYHVDIMSSERALRLALERVATIPFNVLAPRHGVVFSRLEDIFILSQRLARLKGVGIDGIVSDRPYEELGNLQPLENRLRRPEKDREELDDVPALSLEGWEL